MTGTAVVLSAFFLTVYDWGSASHSVESEVKLPKTQKLSYCWLTNLEMVMEMGTPSPPQHTRSEDKVSVMSEVRRKGVEGGSEGVSCLIVGGMMCQSALWCMISG